MRATTLAARQAKIFKKWKDVPVGTVVEYRQAISTPWISGKTSSAPFMLGGHTACVMLEEVSGAFCLEFVRQPEA